MALLIINSGSDSSRWVQELQHIDADLDVRVWPQVGNPEEITFALLWNHPPGELKKYPNLRCLCSMGAGVDHILRDPDLPEGVPIIRLVDRSLVQWMSEYVIWAVLNHYRQFDSYREDQRQERWRPRMPPRPAEVRVGIMGLGQLGTDAAARLVDFGFDVAGWSRTAKSVPGVTCFAGDGELQEFLRRTNILVCMLPLTPKTAGILNRSTFSHLQRGAYLISVGRGQHLVEADLLEALDSGQLSGACLDVFQQEPLPAGHPFWRHPRIIVTPHIASMTDYQATAPQVYDNYRRMLAGKELVNVVDRARGY